MQLCAEAGSAPTNGNAEVAKTHQRRKLDSHNSAKSTVRVTLFVVNDHMLGSQVNVSKFGLTQNHDSKYRFVISIESEILSKFSF